MPNFNYERASHVLAEATLFGRKNVCQIYHVPQSTFDDWRKRSQTDEKLAELYNKALKELKQEWQQDSIKALKMALYIFRQGLENHPFSRQPKDIAEMEAWGKNMDAMAKSIKAIGDLAISGSVLNDDDD